MTHQSLNDGGAQDATQTLHSAHQSDLSRRRGSTACAVLSEPAREISVDALLDGLLSVEIARLKGNLKVKHGSTQNLLVYHVTTNFIFLFVLMFLVTSFTIEKILM